MRRRERLLRSWLKHERQSVRMVLAETFHHSSAPFPPKFKESGWEGTSLTPPYGHRTRLRPGRPRTARRVPEWAGKRCYSSCTTKTPQDGGHPVWVSSPAAHRGADDRVFRSCAHARSRCSCAADVRTVGGCLADPRHVHACRAGYRHAQDLSRQHSTACRASCAAAGGTVGGRASALLPRVFHHEEGAGMVLGRRWLRRGRCSIAGRTGSYWWKSGTTQWLISEGLTASPGRYEIVDTVVDVPVITQLKFPQSWPTDSGLCLRFSSSADPRTHVLPQRQVRTVQTVAEHRRSHSAVLGWLLTRPLPVRRQVPEMVQTVQTQWGCRSCSLSTFRRNSCCGARLGCEP